MKTKQNKCFRVLLFVFATQTGKLIHVFEKFMVIKHDFGWYQYSSRKANKPCLVYSFRGRQCVFEIFLAKCLKMYEP